MMIHSNYQASGRLCVACTLTAAVVLLVALTSSMPPLVGAILVQPNNYMLDDSPMTNQHDSSGSLAPFYNDAQSGAEHQADKDIVSIIGDSLARLRFARMLDQQQQQQQQDQDNAGQLSQEMADLIQSEQAKQEAQAGAGGGNAGSADQSSALSSSVASMLMSVAQAAAAASNSAQSDEQQAQQQQLLQAQSQAQIDSSESSPVAAAHVSAGQSRRDSSIMELDTTQPGQSGHSMPSKSDLKQAGPIQWYNPKETIPVLKISSMATPSKYKKVYFRSEKKLVDGAFHSPSASEQGDKKLGLVKQFATSSSSMANVQRRSSRGTASSAPPSVLQDGVIDFLKKFRDVYVQTRPAGSSPGAGAASASSSPINFASIMSAAASSPLAAILVPNTSGSGGSSRPNFANAALSAAGQMVNSAAMLSQAASSPSGTGAGSSSSSSSGSSSLAANSGSATAAAGLTGSGAAAASGPSKNSSPLSAQSYVSFWSKTFPTWVRKMLKQMRRRSLYNSSKRHQNHHQHSSGSSSSSSSVGQKASGHMANVVDSPGANNSGRSSSMSSSSSSSS